MIKTANLAQVAASNNADLCAAIMRANDLRFERDRSSFVCVDDPPPYYPNLVTLNPDVSVKLVTRVKDIAASGQTVSTIKDSFANLDFSALNMAVLFEASWIWHDGGYRKKPDAWCRVSGSADLSTWHRAWCAAGSPSEEVIFPPASLDDSNLVFLARGSGSNVEAGCIANFSESVTGLSNVFTVSEDNEVFTQATQAVAALRPETPVVGYESGSNLDAARDVGFCEVGKLRVLIQRT